jgi:hypothetical protein
MLKRIGVAVLGALVTTGAAGATQLLGPVHYTSFSSSPFDGIVLDDFQYVLANEYMRRSEETGFQKFSDIGRQAWEIFTHSSALPDDVRVYFLSHTATDDMGHTKFKSIGKLLDEKITVEGMFTVVLRTVVDGGRYQFSTKNNGYDTVKSPMGMFDADRIDNDLAQVDAAICAYYEITSKKEQAA